MYVWRKRGRKVKDKGENGCSEAPRPHRRWHGAMAIREPDGFFVDGGRNIREDTVFGEVAVLGCEF